MCTRSQPVWLWLDPTARHLVVEQGIKQGYPMHFNCVIDRLIRDCQADDQKYRVLAFADDICLIADSRINRISEGLQRIVPSLNPMKYVTMHMLGHAPAGVRVSLFTVYSMKSVTLRCQSGDESGPANVFGGRSLLASSRTGTVATTNSR